MMCGMLLVPIFTLWYPVFDAPWGTGYSIFQNLNTNTANHKSSFIFRHRDLPGLYSVKTNFTTVTRT